MLGTVLDAEDKMNNGVPLALTGPNYYDCLEGKAVGEGITEEHDLIWRSRKGFSEGVYPENR